MTTLKTQSDATIRLSPEEQIRFAGLLAKPPQPNAALKRAQEAHRRLIASSE